VMPGAVLVAGGGASAPTPAPAKAKSSKVKLPKEDQEAIDFVKSKMAGADMGGEDPRTGQIVQSVPQPRYTEGVNHPSCSGAGSQQLQPQPPPMEQNVPGGIATHDGYIRVSSPEGDINFQIKKGYMIPNYQNILQYHRQRMENQNGGPQQGGWRNQHGSRGVMGF